MKSLIICLINIRILASSARAWAGEMGAMGTLAEKMARRSALKREDPEQRGRMQNYGFEKIMATGTENVQ